jgi:hypothetical protein
VREADETPAAGEDQASAGAQIGPSALLHSWKQQITHPAIAFHGRAKSDAN